MYIIDVPSVIHAGAHSGFRGRAMYKGIPTGGVWLLLEHIIGYSYTGRQIVLCFDSPTDARNYIPSYKSDRNPNPSIRFQVKLAYEYLKDAMPNVFKLPNMEADWVAASVCKKMENVNIEIDMSTVDDDWAHNITPKGNVFLVPPRSDLGMISARNFQAILSENGYEVTLNTISAKKVFDGCKSDHIDALENSCDFSNLKLFKAYKTFCKKNGFDTTDKNSMVSFATEFKDAIGIKMQKDILDRSEVIFPRIDTSVVISYDKINKQNFATLGSLIGCRQLLKRSGISFYEDMGELQSRVKQMYDMECVHSKTHVFSETKPEGAIALPDKGGIL